MELFHRDFGSEGRAPLVMLHGLLGSSRNWQTTGKDLAATCHVRALDLRNHGQSPHADAMTYATMVDDVLAWLDAQGLDAVDLMGHSMGGKVAMLLAAQHPERVRRLVIVDIAPKRYRSEAHRAEFSAMHELDLGALRSRAEAEMRFEARVSDWGMRKFLTTNLERDGDDRWRWAINLPALTAALPELESDPLAAWHVGGTSAGAGDPGAGVSEADRGSSTDSGSRVPPAYTGPTLFVLGGRSRYVSQHDHERIRALFPAVQIEVLEGAGHNPHMETREAFVARVNSHVV